jgi:anti-sigma regulatory factor (Ser/Thr protein kinase)
MRADEIGALRAFAAEASALLRQAGYSEADINAFSISLRELVDNVAIHVRPEESVRLEMLHHDGDAPLWHEGFGLDVTDSGSGFDFNDAILRLEQELSERGVEHGLLRAYRLGSWLMQVSVEPHVMSWGRERAPEIMPTVFEADDVVPFIFSYRQQAVQVWRNVHTFTQFEQYLKRSEAFTDLIFDPLLRPARRYVGIEVIGEGWTGVLSWERVLDRLLSFARRNNRFDKEFVLFVDSGPSEHQRMRDYCHDAGIPMFEDESTLRNFRVAIVSKAEPRPRWRGRRK